MDECAIEQNGKWPTYPAYKPSGIEWLGEVPEHWVVKSLKWDSPVQRGASPRPIDDPVYFDDDGEFAWVRIADVTAAGTYLEETTQRLSTLGASLSVKMQPGELFLSIAGSVGKPCITKIKCCIHDGFVYFPRLSCNRKYLYYIFASGEPYKGLGKLGTQLNLNTDTVGSIHIGFPLGDEQQAIVEFLEDRTAKIDELIKAKWALLALLKEKRQALITHAVTKGLDPNAKMKPSGIDWLGEVPEHWEVKSLKYVAGIKSGENITYETIEPEGAYPVFGGNGKRGYTSEYTHDGDFVLIGRQGALCGNVHLVSGRIWASEHCAVATPKNVPAQWLVWILDVMDLGRYSETAAQPGLAVEKILRLQLACPPIAEQISIAEYLDKQSLAVGRVTDEAKSAIARLTEYRTALISAAVTGKIDVRGSA